MNSRNIHRWKWVTLLATLLLVAAAKGSRGQAFGFSISSGGGHHHHGGGWWAGYGYAPYWGPRWYGPPAVVYAAPPPVVQERVIYVQPSTPSYLPPPPGPAPLSSNSIAPPVVAGSNDDRIVIRNASGARLPVSFVMDGQDAELADGATKTFVGSSHRTVQYDRGGQFGSTQQDLTGGQYEFRITASGWDLVRRPDIPAASRTAVKSNSLPSTATSR